MIALLSSHIHQCEQAGGMNSVQKLDQVIGWGQEFREQVLEKGAVQKVGEGIWL